MMFNIKTYRFYANIVLAWHNNYKANKCTMKTLQFVFNTKMNLFANPYMQSNFENEIIKLIGYNDYKTLKNNYLSNALISV